jgi:hypothetical protein
MPEQEHDLAASLEALSAEIAAIQPTLDPALRDRLIFAAGRSAGETRRQAPHYGWAGITLGLVLLSLFCGKWWGSSTSALDGGEMLAHPAEDSANTDGASKPADSPRPGPKESPQDSSADGTYMTALRPTDWMNALDGSEPSPDPLADWLSDSRVADGMAEIRGDAMEAVYGPHYGARWRIRAK